MKYLEFIETMRHINQGPYIHRHHIIPISQGGTDDMSNTIYLSWIAHWWAHQLLLKEMGIQTATTSKSLDTWLRWCYRDSIKNHSEEVRKRIGLSKQGQLKGSKWYNNGTRNIRAYECPEGFVPGRIITEEHREILKHNGKIIGSCNGFGYKSTPIPKEKILKLDENQKKCRKRSVYKLCKNSD